MEYVLLNGAGVVLGAFLGKTIGRKMNQDQLDALLIGSYLALMISGIKGAIATEDTVLMIGCLSVGGILGATLDIDGKFYRLGDWMRKRIKTSDDEFTKGLVALMMVHNIGSMAILGPFAVAINHDPTLLILKTVLDTGITLIYASRYGFGLAISAVVVVVYQGAIYLLSGLLVPVMTPEITAEISAIGSVLFVALSMNLLGIFKVKISNFLPAVFIPMILYWIQQIFTK